MDSHNNKTTKENIMSTKAQTHQGNQRETTSHDQEGLNHGTQIVETSSAENIPAFYANVQDLGVDNIGAEDVIIPRVKIFQAMRDIINTIKGIVEGSFYDNFSQKVFGDTITFFVAYFYKSRLWFDPKSRSLLASQYKDPRTKQMVTFGNSPEIIQSDYESGKDSMNYFIILEEDLVAAAETGSIPLFYMFSCMSAAIPAAKALNTKIKLNTGCNPPLPIWAQQVKASTKMESFDAGDAYMPLFQFGQIISDAKQAAIMQKFASTVATYISKAEASHDAVPQGTEKAAVDEHGNVSDDDQPF
jgi:hypothetical protein